MGGISGAKILGRKKFYRNEKVWEKKNGGQIIVIERRHDFQTKNYKGT